MSRPTISVSLGRSRIPNDLAHQLMALSPGFRGRVVAFILLAHVQRVEVSKLVVAADSLKRLGVLLNQSLRSSAGTAPDLNALHEAANLVNSLRT